MKSLIGENSSDGYILQVDFKYHDEFHELHSDYPLAPEKLEISHNMLSNYCVNEYGIIKSEDVNNLVLNLGNKSKFKHLINQTMQVVVFLD